MKNCRNHRAFTLIELLVVIAIIGTGFALRAIDESKAGDAGSGTGAPSTGRSTLQYCSHSDGRSSRCGRATMPAGPRMTAYIAKADVSFAAALLFAALATVHVHVVHALGIVGPR